MKVVIFDFNRTIFNPDKNELLPNAQETLKELGKIYKIVLLSSGSQERASQIGSLGLESYFDLIKIVERKKLKHIFEIARRLNCKTGDLIIIGDSPNSELSLGVRAGIKTLAVGTGFCTTATAEKLHIKMFNDLSEIKTHLTAGDLK